MRAKAVELAALHMRVTALAKSEAECVSPILLHKYTVLLCRGVLIKHSVTKMQTSAASIGQMADLAYVCHIDGAGQRSGSAEYLVSVTQLWVPVSKPGTPCRLKKAVSATKGEKAALEGEKAALTKAKAVLEKEKAALEKEKAALTGELDTAQKGAEQSAVALAARHKQAAADVSKTLEEIAATEQYLQAVKQKLAALSSDLTA